MFDKKLKTGFAGAVRAGRAVRAGLSGRVPPAFRRYTTERPIFNRRNKGQQAPVPGTPPAPVAPAPIAKPFGALSNLLGVGSAPPAAPAAPIAPAPLAPPAPVAPIAPAAPIAPVAAVPPSAPIAPAVPKPAPVFTAEQQAGITIPPKPVSAPVSMSPEENFMNKQNAMYKINK